MKLKAGEPYVKIITSFENTTEDLTILKAFLKKSIHHLSALIEPIVLKHVANVK